MNNTKDIDELLKMKSEQGKKYLFQERLKSYLQKKLEQRRKRIQEKTILLILKHADTSNDYNYRQNFIDQTIEDSIKYFNSHLKQTKS